MSQECFKYSCLVPISAAHSSDLGVLQAGVLATPLPRQKCCNARRFQNALRTKLQKKKNVTWHHTNMLDEYDDDDDKRLLVEGGLCNYLIFNSHSLRPRRKKIHNMQKKFRFGTRNFQTLKKFPSLCGERENLFKYFICRLKCLTGRTHKVTKDFVGGKDKRV